MSNRELRLWVLPEVYHPEKKKTAYCILKIAEHLVKTLKVSVLCV